MVVIVSNTIGDEGIMGRIAPGTWLPALPSGATVGPMPDSLHERYVALYRTFADAWRVTDQTSMFVYLPWTSTATFSDRGWPPEKPECTLKDEFQKPVTPILENIEIAKAEEFCMGVIDKDLFENCVFDVATTGDEAFVAGYLVTQELRLRSTAVQIVSDKPRTRPGESLVTTATVLPLRRDSPTPTGSLTFLIDDEAVGPAVKLDEQGRATLTTDRLERGVHKIRAAFADTGDQNFAASSSPNLLLAVGDVEDERAERSGAADLDHSIGVPSRATLNGHPIHPMLIPFPIAFLIGAFATDLAYWWTADDFWARVSIWLVGAGFLTGAAAAVFGLVDFVTIDRAREHRIGWVHAVGNSTVLGLALVSLLWRRGDPVEAVVPWGIILSGVIAILLVATGWAGGELAYRHMVGVTGHGAHERDGVGGSGLTPVDDHHGATDVGGEHPH
jgi:uncharacterized membrane protein